ncbi:MAG: gliding motility-associated C-terminal domain-containing protein, partial [Flammeovirgaceae bacterium]|nr:gliding motility-associated C-terminal domain-containing protein [Flammeovirgaceae bacterium]
SALVKVVVPEVDCCQAPIANDDIFNLDDSEICAGKFIPLNLLDNDSLPKVCNLYNTEILSQLDSAWGSFSIDASTGTVNYLPKPGFFGSFEFSYKVCNACPGCENECDSALVKVVVPEADCCPKPITGNDMFELDQDSICIPGISFQFNLQTNDTLPGQCNNYPYKIITNIQPEWGTLRLDSISGILTYVPNPDFSGEFSFGYQACNRCNGCDDKDLCSEAIVTIRVPKCCEPPIANLDEFMLDEEEVCSEAAIEFDLSENDEAPESCDQLKFEIISDIDPAWGVLSLNPTSGILTITPDRTFSGDINIQYKVCNDCEGCEDQNACDTTEITIEVPDCPDCSWTFISNFISPNGDNVNDTWVASCVSKVEIYNRWDDLQFSQTPVGADFRVEWDGKNNNGNLVPDGTYFFILYDLEGNRIGGKVFENGVEVDDLTNKTYITVKSK